MQSNSLLQRLGRFLSLPSHHVQVDCAAEAGRRHWVGRIQGLLLTLLAARGGSNLPLPLSTDTLSTYCPVLIALHCHHQGIDRLLRRSMGLGLVPVFPQGRGAVESPVLLQRGRWGLSGGIVELDVIDEEAGRVGRLLLHLHDNAAGEYPFTTLLRHGALWGPSHGSQRETGDSGAPGQYKYGANDDLPTGDDGGSSDLPVALIRIQNPVDPSLREGEGVSNSGDGPLDGPYFLRVLLHELGHALHYICSSGGGGAAAATDAEPSTAEAVVDGVWGAALPPAPSLSAAQCPLDIKEIPSHLLEHWAKDPECLQV